MDRLEPILKQKFWILLGIGMIMAVTGWWMATGTMATEITKREGEIKAAEGKIPSGQIPNDDWSKKLAAVNSLQETAVKVTTQALWERQMAKMSWPQLVHNFAWEKGYQQDINVTGRENYRNEYTFEARRVWETVRPFSRLDGSGIVDFPFEKFPQRRWGDFTPRHMEMWEAQEDLWLLESLLQSILELNGGPNGTRQDAAVHVIERLTLHGGAPPGQRKASAPAGGGGGASSSGSAAGMTGDMIGSGSGAGGAPKPATVDFDPQEEFGPDGGSGAGGGGDGGSSAMPFGAGGSGGGGGGALAKSARRYVDDDAASPFKTRGFYMTVYMDHRKVPYLIAQLSASETSAWPVEIIRVNVARVHFDDLAGTAGGGGGAPGFGSSGPFASGAEPFSGGSGSGSFPPTFAGGAESFGSSGAPATFGAEGGGLSTTNAVAGATDEAKAAIGLLNNALQDPYLAKVSLCGLITLYREVKPAPAPANTAAPATTNPPQNPPAATGSPATTPAAAGATPEAKSDNAGGATPSDKPASEPTDKGADPSKLKEPNGETDKPATTPSNEKPAEPGKTEEGAAPKNETGKTENKP